MKLFLLKILLQRRARDEGFTLPLVIAIGLVMILLGTVNILSANEENLSALTQNSRSDALAVAEVGVARYRELIDKNRVLAIYDLNEWSNRTQVCSGDIATLANTGTSHNVNISEGGVDMNNNGTTSDTFTVGTYSIVNYDYSNADGTFDLTDDAANNNATGTLTVQSETPDGSQAQIEVDIPIRINQQDMDNLAPALWIGDNTVSATDLGNLTIGNGNVVIRDPAAGGVDKCNDFSALQNANRPVISDPRNIPPIDSILNTVTAADTAAGSNSFIAGEILGEIDDNPYNPNTNNTNCTDISDCRYYYNLGGLTITDDVETDGIAKVTLYVGGDISINVTAGNPITIGSQVSSNYFEIYSTGSVTITANDNLTINAFIHAPNGTLTITGNGTVNINGSVWVGDFVNSTSATVDISPDTTDVSSSSINIPSYEFYTTTVERTPRPLTNAPTNWKTEEVN